MGRVAIRARRVLDPPRVEIPGFSGLVRVASGTDGVPPFPQGNPRAGENRPPAFDMRGVACGTRSDSAFSLRQGGMLRPPPKDRTTVLYGSVVATAADPLLIEGFFLPGREKGGIEEDAFPDVAEGTVLLVEGGTWNRGSFEKERQKQRKGENPFFQQARDPMIRRRSPS